MEWLYGASESSNMEVDIGYLPQVCALSQCSTCLQLLLRGFCAATELWNLCDSIPQSWLMIISVQQ